MLFWIVFSRDMGLHFGLCENNFAHKYAVLERKMSSHFHVTFVRPESNAFFTWDDIERYSEIYRDFYCISC